MATAKFDGLNVEEFEKWLTALESGDYEQGRSALHEVTTDGPRFCCLGVVSHLTAEVCGIQVTLDQWEASYKYDGQGGYLPGKVATYLGIPESHSEHKSGGTCSIMVTLDKEAEISFSYMYEADKRVSVAQLNDSGHFSFVDIARLLRKEFLNEDEVANA